MTFARPTGLMFRDNRDGRTEADEADPVLGGFLEFLAHDMATPPERLGRMDGDFVARIQSLVKDVEVDRKTPLSPDDE